LVLSAADIAAAIDPIVTTIIVLAIAASRDFTATLHDR